MYLRNKKTGEVVDWSFVGPTAIKEYEGEDVLLERERYESIEEFISEWEDYVPKEPLIKAEKKLDAVRSFFALLGITEEIYYQSINNCFYHTDDDGITYGIDFNDDKGIDNIGSGLPYTIDELCGENEE